jgi:Holliday junction resolvase-like predicted endonuclease
MMTIEKDVVLSLLKLTENGPVHKEAVAKHARVLTQLAYQVLRKLSENEFFYESKSVIEVTPAQRVRLALYSLRLGADFQKICDLLSWREFENIAAQAFEDNGYEVLRNFHLQHNSKRWEIDLIGLKKPLVLCVDCKHWKRGWRQSATSNAVRAQIERTEALSKTLGNYRQKIKVDAWETVTLIPVIMSLTLGPYKVYDDVPVVPVLQLQDFINELPAHVPILKKFSQKVTMQTSDLSRFL